MTREAVKSIFSWSLRAPGIRSLDAEIGLWDVLGLELLLGPHGLPEKASGDRVSLLPLCPLWTKGLRETKEGRKKKEGGRLGGRKRGTEGRREGG